jgi:hypothetical protein
MCQESSTKKEKKKKAVPNHANQNGLGGGVQEAGAGICAGPSARSAPA